MVTLYNYVKRSVKQASNKKVRPHEIQEGDFVPKRVLPFQPDPKGRWTPSYESPWAMTFTAMDGDNLARPVKADAVKKYFVNMKSSISRKPEKAA